MPDFIHGRNAQFFLWDTTGACQNLSGDLNNVTIDWSRDNPDVTTFGKETTQRISGIRDYTVQVAAVYSAESGSGAQAVLAAHMTASANILFKFYKGSSTGCEFWTGCTHLSAYQETAPVNGPIALSFTLQASSGSLTASTV